MPSNDTYVLHGRMRHRSYWLLKKFKHIINKKITIFSLKAKKIFAVLVQLASALHRRRIAEIRVGLRKVVTFSDKPKKVTSWHKMPSEAFLKEAFNGPVSNYQTSHLSPSLRGIKQKKLYLDSGMNKSLNGFIPLSLRAKYEFC